MQSRGADQTELCVLACTSGLNCLLKLIQQSHDRWWASGENSCWFSHSLLILLRRTALNCPCFCAGCCNEYYGVLVSNSILNNILKDMRERRGTWQMRIYNLIVYLYLAVFIDPLSLTLRSIIRGNSSNLHRKPLWDRIYDCLSRLRMWSSMKMWTFGLLSNVNFPGQPS